MTYENISPSEAKSRMDADPEAVIVDVRRPDEFVTGHIPLYALESLDPIKDFDFIGFTLQYEMSYTNVLEMLDLDRKSVV